MAFTASDILAALQAERLEVFGALGPGPDAGAPKGTATLLLLGPAEPGFWSHVSASAEMRDGRPDPLDRWSRRVIGRMACRMGGKAVFPFAGPPYAPFPAWARASGVAWTSPVGLLVQAQAGLMVSFRGALALRDRYDPAEFLPAGPPAPPARPCGQCEGQPCRSACPVDALGPHGYDLAACRRHLASPAGQPCLDGGCLARRACPISVSYGRIAGQSAYHMRHFSS